MRASNSETLGVSKNDNQCLLPQEIIEDILLRLPVKSLGRFKLVSKLWKSFISSPFFVKVHLNYTALNNNKAPLIIFTHSCQRGLASLKFDDDGVKSLSVTTALLDTPFLTTQPQIYVLGSVDGLVCICDPHAKSIYIWNPAMEECKEISYPEIYISTRNILISRFSWFGFVPSLNDYRIFLTLWAYGERRLKLLYLQSFRDAKWIHKSDIDCHTLFSSVLAGGASEAVYLNGKVHCGLGNNVMVVFDHVQETIEEVPLPHTPVDDDTDSQCRTYLFTQEEKTLCAWQSYQTCKKYFAANHIAHNTTIRLWKLEQYGNWDSWKLMHKLRFEIFSEVLHPRHWIPILSGRVLIHKIEGQVLLVNTSSNKDTAPTYIQVAGQFPCMDNLIRQFDQLCSESCISLLYTLSWIELLLSSEHRA